MQNEKFALVTGVTRKTGLGLETARQLVQLGYNVIITGRQMQTVMEVAGDNKYIPLELDVTDQNSIDQAATVTQKIFGRLDVLINNAAGYFDQQGSLLDTDLGYLQAAFDTNVGGALRTTKAFLPLLLESHAGRIVNVSSSAGAFSDTQYGLFNHPAKVPVYSITKLALNGLTVKLASELSHTGIKVNAVCPGLIATWPGAAQRGARPVSDGAKGVIWAATLPPDGPSGGFFRDGQPIGW